MITRNTFLSVAASIVAANLAAGGKAEADQVIPDDLIVQGSLCVGFDCVNNENFGFDTIKLKENNLRIKFEDTSVGAFPSNDWQLTANDSVSGGASKFSIEDVTGAKVPFTVIAGAPNNSMFVSSSGKVGFRTAAPGLDLHITTLDTPAHRLEQTNAGGFTAQTWDIAGNEANFFVRDLTGGSRLPFRIRPGAPTSSIDISASGNVGIGTASPDTKLTAANNQANTNDNYMVTIKNGDVPTAGMKAGLTFVTGNGAAAAKLNAINDGVSGTDLAFVSRTNNADTERMRILAVSGNVGVATTTPQAKLDVNGTVRVGTLGANPPANTVCFAGANNVLGTCASDGRLKHNVRYLQENAGLSAVMKLKPATFQWHDGDERVMAGLIAQETQVAIPEAVFKSAGSEFLSLDSAAVLSYAIKAIQELKADNEQLRTEVERLKASR